MFKEQIYNFRFFILVVLCSLGGYTAISQNLTTQEVDAELVNFSSLSPVQSEMDHLTGWAKQDNGRWLSAANRIPFTDEKTNQSTASERKLGQDNIISLQLRKVMIGNEQYNVLVKQYHDGDYEFPILQEGWRSFKSLDFYVFKSSKLADLLPNEIPFNKAYAVNLNVYARGTVKNFEEKSEDDEIIKTIQSIERGETVNDWNLIVAIFPIKNGDEEVVRFKLIKSFRKKYLVSYYAAPENWSKNFDMTFYDVKLFRFKSFIRDAQEFVLPVTNPDNPVAANDAYTNNYNWGILKYQMGDYPTAIEYFDKALQENPDTPDFLIYSFRGNARSKMRLYGDAIDDFDKALDFQPDDIMNYSNWIRNYFNRGVAKYYMQDLTGACKDWNKALELGFGPAHDYLLNYCQ
ncbi:MAG: tetratricopeptide repeat protein [Bacteroidales bacterium]|nr:tetratricopeptide repeat protein [Bacteroidales bacterium]